MAQAEVERQYAALREAGVEEVFCRNAALFFFFFGDGEDLRGARLDAGEVFVALLEAQVFDVVPAAHRHAVVQGDGAHGGVRKGDARRRSQLKLRQDGDEVVAIGAEAVQPDDAVGGVFFGAVGDSFEGLCHNFAPFLAGFRYVQVFDVVYCNGFVRRLRAEGAAVFAG